MKVRVITKKEGFYVTLKSQGHKKEASSVNDPAIDKKMTAIKQNIQSELCKVVGIPNKVRNSRTKLVDSTSAMLTTPERALAGLVRVRDLGLLKVDFGPAIATFKKSQEYQDALAEALAAGKRPRDPNAFVRVDILLREEEDQMVFGKWPQDIIDNIGIFREIPHDVQPVYDAAEIISDYEASFYKAMEHGGYTDQKKILVKAKSVLTDDLDKILRSIFPETDAGKDAKSNLETTLRADITQIDSVINGRGWHLRTYVQCLLDPDNFLVRCGFGGFTERLMGSQTTPMNVNRNDMDSDIDIDTL